ncbi:hypothetical protein [Lacisediminihabitans sp.]|uniref:hypothetical protein n=1 Tax=Lacisediminihabitans sp. TaxID=2787631 RepID=UPI00374DA16B
MATLTDRYVWAVARAVPRARRAEAETRVRASVDDAIAAKVAGGTTSETAELDAITELGDPDRRAAEYVGRLTYLIGPAYFFDYRRVLIVVVSVAAPAVFFALMLAQLIVRSNPLEALGTALSAAFSVAVQVAFWTTLAFAVIERTAPERRDRATLWKPALLPKVPTAEKIGIGSTIAGVLGYLLFIGLIVWQGNIWVVRTAGGERSAMLDPALWTFWLPWFIAVAVLEIVFVAVSYAIGHWTWGLAWANVALNLVFAVPAVWLLATDQVFNRAFLDMMAMPADVVRIVSAAFEFVVVLVAILDIVDGFRRAWRSQRAVHAEA